MATILPGEEHLDEAISLLSKTTVVAIFYTFVVILYCLSFRLSYAQLRGHGGNVKRRTAFTLVLATVLLICATIDVIVKNRVAQVIYIDNSMLPGGPLYSPAVLRVVPLINLGGIVNMIENILILGVLLLRVSVIWSGTRFAIHLKMISSFFYLGNAGLIISYSVITWNTDLTSHAARPRTESIIFILGEVFFFTSLLFMTSAIIGRLVYIREKHIKLMGKSDVARQYLGIAAMFIESYALDSLWGTGLIISYGLNYTPTTTLFNNCATQVDIMTNLLLIYRVLSGRAWTRKTQGRLSSLRWASIRAGTTSSGTVDLPQTSVPQEDLPMIGCHDGV